MVCSFVRSYIGACLPRGDTARPKCYGRDGQWVETLTIALGFGLRNAVAIYIALVAHKLRNPDDAHSLG